MNRLTESKLFSCKASFAQDGFWGAGVPLAEFNTAGGQLRPACLSHVFNSFHGLQDAPYRPIGAPLMLARNLARCTSIALRFAPGRVDRYGVSKRFIFHQMCSGITPRFIIRSQLRSCTLSHKQVTGFKRHAQSLLCLALDRHKPHRRT